MTFKSRTLLFSTFLILALSAQACRVSQGPAANAASASATSLPRVTQPASTVIPVLANDTSTPRVVPASTLISTPTPAPVSLTAVNGDLAVRAGPDVTFDAIARLKEGQTVPVYARSIQDGWVQVPIPSGNGATGWVSLQSGYSKVDGYVLDLPLISTVEWPFGAYLLNCTAHQLLVQPGDKLVPGVGAAPANRVWFYPGLYTAYDADVQGKPEITQVKLWVRTTVSVIKDGAGQKYTCP